MDRQKRIIAGIRQSCAQPALTERVHMTLFGLLIAEQLRPCTNCNEINLVERPHHITTIRGVAII